MSLKKDSGGNPEVVDSVSDALCTKDIYSLPPTDPAYNSDCREFYNKNGQITYHLISNTISCSDNCHTYRLNEKNIDKSLTADSCTGNDKNWDASQGACYVCKNGGVWNTKQNNCLYQAVPDEGTTCSSDAVGCREYNGNNGSTLHLVGSYDFEADVNGFSGVSGASVAQSTESTAKNGHSLAYTSGGSTGEADLDVSNYVSRGSSYVIKFIAKAGSKVNANIYLENSVGESSIFGADDNNPQGNLVIKGDNQWNIYEINLRELSHNTVGEKLKIKADANFFMDNLIVNEITDKYYLIKGSSDIPDVCYYDMNDKYQGPNYNLGCSQYKDRSGTINNLHQFSELCQNSAVGCELMIQTHDLSSYYGYTLNLNNSDRTVNCVAGTPGCLDVKGHQAIYAVFDSTKQCNQADQGCSRFGYSQTIGATTSWLDAYKKNLPDTYDNPATSPLCQSSEVGCDTWSYENGSNSYFKDPGFNTCVFRDDTWYKSPVMRCDTNGDNKIAGTEKSGSVCLTDNDCGGSKCITDNNNYSCPVSFLKTFGYGGAGGRIATPDGMTGICDAASATCGEYIDPTSKFVNNLIYNPTAEDIDKNGSADKWTEISNPAGYFTQKITVKPNKLYVLRVDGPVADDKPVILKDFYADKVSSQVRVLGGDNKLSDLASTLTATSSILFNSGSTNNLTVYRYGTTTSATTDKTSVSIKEAIINYQLSSNIDAKTCNGVVNTDGGCVLFNNRTQSGRNGLQPLTFNAYNTADGSAPTPCSGANCSANSVIKVTPDRVCSRWLSCKTYIEDPITHEKVCYSMGECDQLNDKNECSNFLPLDNTVRDIKNSQNKNATGYSLLNNYYLGFMKEVGQNTEAHFDFESTSASLSCRRDVDIPNVQALNDAKGTPCAFDKSINDSLVLEPNTSTTDYPAHGKGYLKVLNYYQISPQSNNSSISVYTNQDYYINYLVNTKGSNAKSKIVIVNNDNNTPQTYVRFVDDAPNKWERKIHRFRISGANNTKVDIKIYLTSDTTDTNNGYVYFDDINIEPVLQVGADNYVSKDCRLYPADDSLSCLSANNNVIKDGLHGYCLQYDPLKP